MTKPSFTRIFLLGSLLILPLLASAAPRQIKAEYEATRNGLPFATVTETYTQDNGRYRVESVTQGLGVYALFGKRMQVSEGEVTAEGLKPKHFELRREDNPKKSLFADFDWAASQLHMKNKGKQTTVPLQKGAQDLVSFVYQFMFKQPAGNDFTLPVTTGKRLQTYHYKVTERKVPIQVPAGKFTTLHLVNAEATETEDEKELWLGAESYFLPVRLIVHDDDGGKIEQTLTSLHAE